MIGILGDVRYALRTLGRNAGFTAVAGLTLAIGIGANVAMFSIVDRTLLRPLTYADPDRLYAIHTVVPLIGWNDGPINARHFHEWRTRCEACLDVALVGGNGFTLATGEPERLPGLEVSFNFFRTLGVPPALGRDFLAGDEGPASRRVAILSDALWRRRFAADPAIVGRTAIVNGEPVEVIGVMGAGLTLPSGEQWGRLFAHNQRPDIFLPFRLPMTTMRGGGNFNYAAILRLAPGATASQAAVEMQAALAGFVREFGVDMRARLTPLKRQITSGATDRLWLLMGAVAALLLIVCVNVGNLMLVRGSTRHPEMRIRLALGATQGEVLRVVLAEAGVLVLVSGAVGMVLATAAVQAFAAAAPIDLPRLEEVRVDWRAFVFAASLTAGCAVACGLLPAWRLAYRGLRESLTAGAQSATDSGGRLRFRDMLVGVEVAVSALLLIVAGLLIVSFIHASRVDVGFDARRLVVVDVPIGPQVQRYRDAGARTRFVDRALEQLRQIPGVDAVGVTSSLPLAGETWIDDVVDADRPPAAGDPPPLANYRFVSPGYFATMGIAITRGRDLDGADRPRPVALISERVASRLWPNGDAIGKRLRRGVPGRPLLVEVIGVVANVRAEREVEAPMTVYEPYWAVGPGGPSFVLRTTTAPAAVFSQIRSAIRSIDPGLPLQTPRAMEDIADASVAVRRFQTLLAAAFAGAAVLLAALGIYGVVSFAVARRTRELGLRSALGAEPAQLLSMVLRQGMTPVAAGLVAGVVAAAAVARALGSQLYGVAPHDPPTFIVAVVMLALSGAIACWLPARRAARLDPLTALRHE